MSKLKLSTQEGQTLILALIVLGIGSLLISPLLFYVSTKLTATRIIEERLKEQYAADSGFEYALWQLQTGVFTGTTGYAINNKAVEVTWGEYISQTYKITSTATSGDRGSTTIESYIKIIPGSNLDIFKGALVSGGDITLKKNCTVSGTIYYEGTFTASEGFTQTAGGPPVYGGWTWPTQEENEAFAGVYRDGAMEGGTWEGEDEYTIPPPTNLGPVCIDGDLKVTQDTTLTLEGTIYVTGSITMKNTITITGTGSIIATGDITFEKMLDYSTEGSSIIMSLNGDITFNMEADVEALIYAPNGTVWFKKKATITGGVVGANDVQCDEEIWAFKGSSFTFDGGPWNTLELAGYNPGSLEIRTYNIYPQSE